MSENTKKYALFAYSDYERQGGWNDFKGMFETPEEAKAYIAAHLRLFYDLYEIVDLTTPEEVEYGQIGIRGKIITEWKK